MANDYLSRPPEVRDQTIVIVHANADRVTINELIRDGLKKQGVIQNKGVNVHRLIDKGLTKAEYKSLKSYNENDVLKIAKAYYQVKQVDLDTKSLLLKDGASQLRYFYPEKEADKHNLELYRHEKKEMAVGDIIRLTKTDNKRKLYANFIYTVKAIDQKQVVLEPKEPILTNNLEYNKEPKSQIVLNHGKPKNAHWDYALTVTSYGFQGGSAEHAINFEASYRKLLSNRRSFYIGSSRARQHLIIYTDNKDKQLRQVFRNKGDKYSALEVTGEIEDSLNNLNNKELTSTQEPSKKSTTENKPYATFYDVKNIQDILTTNAEAVIERILGRPNEKLSSATEWRYGNKGSFVINLSSAKRGLWYDFESGDSGNLITLLQKKMGLTFPEALKYVSCVFGSYKHSIMRELKEGLAHKQSKGLVNDFDFDPKENTQKEKTSKYAKKLAEESLPIKGTIVEKYLKDNRNILDIDSTDIRYHPKVFTGKDEKQKYLPAMLSIAKDRDGNVQCVQATYLNPKDANKADLLIKKRTYGSPARALVSLNTKNNQNSKISFIAEGTETGLSINNALKDLKNSEVVITLGKSNFTSLDPISLGKKVILCLDYDGPKTLTDSTIHRAAARLIEAGKEVFMVMPGQFNNTGSRKLDFNDVLKSSGIEGVKNALNNCIPYSDWQRETEKILPNLGEEINLPNALKLALDRDTFLRNEKEFSFLPRPSEINIAKASQTLYAEQRKTLSSYLQAYSQIQNNDLNKNQQSLNLNDTQKVLSKTQREIC